MQGPSETGVGADGGASGDGARRVDALEWSWVPMTQRLCLVAALAALIAGAAGAVASAGGDRSPTASCRWDRLRWSIETQGENTTTWIGVELRNSGPACALSGAATLTIEQLGHPARVVGNPLRLPLHGLIGPGRERLLRADWDNWCGSRRGLSLRVRYGRVGVLSRFSHLPVCLSRSGPSRLRVIG
jgi:hypothetical protein